MGRPKRVRQPPGKANTGIADRVRVADEPDEAEVAALLETLPFWRLRERDGVVGMFPRDKNGLAAGASMPTGEMLYAFHLLQEGNLASEADWIRGVVVNDERGGYVDRHASDLHREAIRMLCGDDGVALLERYQRISTSAWIYTGGDVSKASRGVFPLLHWRWSQTAPLFAVQVGQVLLGRVPKACLDRVSSAPLRDIASRVVAVLILQRVWEATDGRQGAFEVFQVQDGQLLLDGLPTGGLVGSQEKMPGARCCLLGCFGKRSGVCEP